MPHHTFLWKHYLLLSHITVKPWKHRNPSSEPGKKGRRRQKLCHSYFSFSLNFLICKTEIKPPFWDCIVRITQNELNQGLLTVL